MYLFFTLVNYTPLLSILKRSILTRSKTEAEILQKHNKTGISLVISKQIFFLYKIFLYKKNEIDLIEGFDRGFSILTCK